MSQDYGGYVDCFGRVDPDSNQIRSDFPLVFIKLLMEVLRSLSGKLEDLRARCPMEGCGVGKDGDLAALWRRWLCLRRGVGLLVVHTQQRGEEWRDVTTSVSLRLKQILLHLTYSNKSTRVTLA